MALDEDWDPELEAALAASRVDFFGGAAAQDLELIAALEASRVRPEDLELERAIQASLYARRESPEDLKDVEAALKASQQDQEKDSKQRDLIKKQEDGSDLFQAALRASRVDLGPRGISQVAKIMATGDPNLGQAQVLAKRPESRSTRPSHSGAGPPPSAAAKRGASSALRHTGAALAQGKRGGDKMAKRASASRAHRR
ncbi:unnamed protein product [Durusdinium trenchii]|uniref:Uncharacterized protein n=1 Tax=Durusdinium trenchii TaxID=1381693 RepID=A0ABP0HGZ2_9DINO